MSKKITREDFQPAHWHRLLYKIFTSFFLAMWVMVFMTLITLVGTLYQVDHGLFAAKQKYFHSWFLIHYLGDGVPLPAWAERIPIPLPGGLFLMVLLTLNIIAGGLIHVKKRQKGIGMVIAHFGIVLLLVSGYVTYAFNREGYMALYEGKESDRIESYRRWQIEIVPLDDAGKGRQAFVIPPEAFEGIREGKGRTIQSEELPFDVVLSDYVLNGVPVPDGTPVSKDANPRVVDGFRILSSKPAKEAEQNLPAMVASFRPKGGEGEPVDVILSARSSNFDPNDSPMAYGFEVGGEKFAALMVKQNWKAPFTVRLDQFIFERHPGVSTARNYESRITRIDDRGDVAVEIKMNEPMRDQGFTFFQESFGPADARPGEPMYSQFAVHNNPADQWPLWSLLITTAGLSIHFVIKLTDHTERARRRADKVPSKVPPLPDDATAATTS